MLRALHSSARMSRMQSTILLTVHCSSQVVPDVSQRAVRFSRESLRLSSLNNLRIKCAECKEQFERSRLEEHKKLCVARVRSCSFKKCEFSTADWKEALNHLIEEHKNEIWTNFDRFFKLQVPGIF